MLDSMRKQGASVFLYLVFGLLIAIFVININPGSKQGDGGGCSTGGNAIVTVDGSRVGKNAYLVAYSNRYIPNFMKMWGFKTSKEREFAAVEMLIRREILAQAAADRGLRVNEDMVQEEIKKGYFFLAGLRIPLEDAIFDRHDDEKAIPGMPGQLPTHMLPDCNKASSGTACKTWNADKFNQWYRGLNVSKNAYLDEQTRGMQAALMQEMLLASVRVSKEEARDAYIFQKSTVSYDVVSFEPGAYRSAMKLTDADIARYLAAHEEEVKARFKSDERTYKDVKPQVKLRQIFIAKADEKKEEPKPEPPAAGSGSGSAAGAGSGSAAPKKDDKKDDKKPVGLPIEEAKTKLEAARVAIAGGKKKFSEAVTELSSDEAAKANGGDLGWRTQDSPNLGDKALNDQVKALKPGEMSAVVTVADKGVYLVKVEELRPLAGAKDLTYDQVKLEIAAELARTEWSKEAAKRAALTALASAREGTGKNLGELFPESVEDKMRRTIQQQMQQQGGAAPDIDMGDEPMAWKPGDDAGSSGSAGSAGSATPAAGGGSGSAAPAPDTKTPAPAPTKPEPKAIEPTKDELPKFADIPKQSAKKFGPYPRVPQLPGIGKELVPVVFDELSAGMLAKRVYEVDGNYVLVQVTTKGEASMEQFDKDAPAIVGQMRMMRAMNLVDDFLKSRCQQLEKDGKITVPADLKQAATDDNNKPVQTYRACMTFR